MSADYYVEAFTNFERLAAAGFLPDVVCIIRVAHALLTSPTTPDES